MASNLRVDSIVPATGSSVSIGTATGSVSIPGVLTYEDVTNVDSVGLITARSGIRIAAGSTVGPVSGIITYFGDGSQLTGISGISVANQADNRLITATGTTDALNGESELTFSSSKLNITSTTQGLGLNLRNTGNEYTNIQFDAARTSAGNALGIINAKWNNNHEVAAIYLQAGDDTTNKDDGKITFYTSPSGGSISEALSINQNGYVTKSKHPAFHARLQSNTGSTANPLVYGDVRVNNGSHYNSSGSDAGKFVVPVAGMYFFYLVAVKYNNGSVCRLYPYVNGSKIYNNMHLRLQETGTYSNGSLQFIYTCAVGDKVHVSLEAGSVLGAEYTHFGGHLIG